MLGTRKKRSKGANNRRQLTDDVFCGPVLPKVFQFLKGFKPVTDLTKEQTTKIKDRIKRAIKSKEHVARVRFHDAENNLQKTFQTWKDGRKKAQSKSGVYILKHHGQVVTFKLDKLGRVLIQK